MSCALSDTTRRRCRELQMADIEATWPDALRERLRANDGDARIYGIWQRTFLTGLFDPLRQFLDPTRAAVNVGALLGQYSLTLAAHCTRLLCVEPLEQYRFVAKVLPPNCVWKTVAAGEQVGRGTMHSPISADGSVEFGLSSLQRPPSPNAVVREQATPILPLDQIVANALGDEPIGFIKIDAEGYELSVLRGAAETIARHRPTLLIEAEDVHAVRAWLEPLGYRGVFFFRRRLIDVAQFEPSTHRAPEHVWSPKRAERYDPDLVMSDLYFIPNDAHDRTDHDSQGNS